PTLTIPARDAAPVLSTVAAGTPYTAVDSNPASSTPVTLLSAATVSDVDNLTLASAKVSISSGFLTGDVLAFTNTSSTTYGNITASYDATNGVLSLTSAGATATLAQWQAALDAVQYSSTSSDPTHFGNDPSRTISWAINDGTLDSAAQTTTLNIKASTLTIPAGSTTTLNGGTLQASVIDVEGTVIGFGTIIANVLTNNGTITSKSAHTLTIEISSSIQGTGLLEITNN